MSERKAGPFRFRAHLAWGDDEVEVLVSLAGLVPSCFRPDTRRMFAMKTIPEDTEVHGLLRKLVEKHEIVRKAILIHGVPDIFRIKDLEGATVVQYESEPKPPGGGPVMH